MDTAVLPANGSWTTTAGGAPVAVQFQGWDDATHLRVSYLFGSLTNPVYLTLNTEDANLRTAAGLVVDTFGPILIPGP